MKLALIALPSLLFVAGCDDAPADGYRFGKPEFERGEITVRFVEHDSLAELRKAYPGRLPADRDLMVWSALDPKGGPCVVHIVNPRTSYAPEWLGHEIAHCAWGRWHS